MFLLAGCDSNDSAFTAYLDGLTVSGSRTALNPGFDPAITRYSVIANSPADPITIEAAASSAVTISINGAPATSGAAVTLDSIEPGDTVQIVVQSANQFSAEATTYELLYLPADFPELTVTVREDGVSADPLYINLRGPNSSYVAILDNHGVPTFYRREPFFALDFKWHAETGERSYARFIGTTNQWGRQNTERVVLDDDFNEVELITTVGLSHTDHHDFLIQPNDEILLLSYDGALRDLTAFGLTAAEPVEDSVIQVLDRNTRQVLFEWNSWDDLPYGEQLYVPPRLEYVHANSMIVDTDGNIITSLRGMSQVIKISRPGGQVLWKLSGVSNDFTFINDPYGQTCGQHSASRLGNGNLLIFDNGTNCDLNLPERIELTRVVEYRLDEQALEAELVWSYSQEGVHSRAQGSAQRLDNGNTLIGWGFGSDTFLTEVTSDGTKVFEMTAILDGTRPIDTYRALRFPE